MATTAKEMRTEAAAGKPDERAPSRGQGDGTANSLGEQASKIVDDVREMGEIARSSAGDTLATGKEHLGVYEERLVTYVKEAPVKSVLMAAGVGALLALLVRRG
jgi:ElaB/YqjD/DUF883 family membrane-anchored ribosome-binding protein